MLVPSGTRQKKSRQAAEAAKSAQIPTETADELRPKGSGYMSLKMPFASRFSGLHFYLIKGAFSCLYPL